MFSRFIRLILLIPCLLLVATVPGTSVAAEPERLTLVLDGETVEQAVAALAVAGGLSIEITGALPDDRRIYDTLEEVTLSEGLSRILGQMSHVLAWNDADSLAVILLNNDKASAEQDGTDSPQLESFIDDSAIYSVSSDEMIPPDDFGVPVTALPDLEIEDLFEPFDPDDVIPPDEDG